MPHTLKREVWGHGDTSRLGSPGILRASRVRADDREGWGGGGLRAKFEVGQSCGDGALSLDKVVGHQLR